ncbi:hypothetical protein GGX14DRAFT_453404, partial [Mycena pura]
ARNAVVVIILVLWPRLYRSLARGSWGGRRRERREYTGRGSRVHARSGECTFDTAMASDITMLERDRRLGLSSQERAAPI